MAISPGEINSLRADINRMGHPHRYTRTPLTQSWIENPEGNTIRVPGTPVSGLPCRYRAEETLRTDTGGRTTIYQPSLALPYDVVLEVGDQVSDIVNSDGVVLVAGPLTVESVTDSASFGPSLGKRAYLRAGDAR